MQFKAIASIEVGSNLLSSLVAIAMAMYGAGYWSLVAKPVLLAAFTLIGVGSPAAGCRAYRSSRRVCATWSSSACTSPVSR
jgi:hypothetical protein